jgi:hypothetical protein
MTAKWLHHVKGMNKFNLTNQFLDAAKPNNVEMEITAQCGNIPSCRLVIKFDVFDAANKSIVETIAAYLNGHN